MPAAKLASPESTDPSVWSLTGSEEFDWLDPARWTKYSGVPGCCPDTWWDASQVQVAEGNLVVSSRRMQEGRWLSGGVSAADWDRAHQQYGRYDVRLRVDPGAGISFVGLLWPTQGFPPEIDYFESFREWGERQKMMVTTHFTQGGHQLRQGEVRGDFTRWHVFSLRWTPDQIQVLVDDQVVYTTSGAGVVPQTTMWPGFQSQVERNEDGSLPSTSAASMYIDWMKVYSYQP